MKNRVESAIKEAVVTMATEKSAAGQLRVSNKLKKKGLFISLVGVHLYGFTMSCKRFKNGLKPWNESLQQKVLFFKDQVSPSKKPGKKSRSLARSRPIPSGYLGTQDTYYVGTVKGGVGRIYQ